MKALVNKDAGLVLTTSSDEPIAFGGEWGELVRKGIAVWVDYPPGEVSEDCDLTGGATPVLTVNPTRKAARLAAISNLGLVRQRIRDYDDDTATIPQAKQFRKDIRAAIQSLIGG